MSKFTMEVEKDKAVLTLEINGKKFVERWYKKERGWWGAKDKPLGDQAENAQIKISDRFYEALENRELTELMEYMPKDKRVRGNDD